MGGVPGAASAGQATSPPGVKPSRPNVLMIVVDDLRPSGEAFGAPQIRTPHIDRLARGGLVFTRAYTQQAVCSPSRTAVMTGLRPDTTRVLDLRTHFRKARPDAITLPQHFKQHGYHTQGLGKVYHGGLDDPSSWSTPHWTSSRPDYYDPKIRSALEHEKARLRAEGVEFETTPVERDPVSGVALRLSNPRGRARGPAWEAPDVSDDELKDGDTASKAIVLMESYGSRPFFLAVGLVKPHLPFVAPRKYFDLYPLESVTLSPNPRPPAGVPAPALPDWSELRSYLGMPQEGPMPDAQAREIVRAYAAAASYADAQVGRMLDALDRLGLAGNTVVVLWGDHGWHLGDQGHWTKHTNFEIATRAPLVVRAPGRGAEGRRSDALVEFVDIYPTLCELAGLPVPTELEGTSLAPLLDAPARPWKGAAFSQYPRGKLMGRSMRTDRYRYTEWAAPGEAPAARELYDHQLDPLETVNRAGDPALDKTVAELSARLAGGWRAARPPAPAQ